MTIRFSIGKKERKEIKEFLQETHGVKVTDKHIDSFCRAKEEFLYSTILDFIEVPEESEEPEISLTELEKDVIYHGFGDNEYNSYGEATWTWSVQPNCKIVTKEQISGVIGSLVKKGLAKSFENGEDSTVELTETGKKILETYQDSMQEENQDN